MDTQPADHKTELANVRNALDQAYDDNRTLRDKLTDAQTREQQLQQVCDETRRALLELKATLGSWNLPAPEPIDTVWASIRSGELVDVSRLREVLAIAPDVYVQLVEWDGEPLDPRMQSIGQIGDTRSRMLHMALTNGAQHNARYRLIGMGPPAPHVEDVPDLFDWLRDALGGCDDPECEVCTPAKVATEPELLTAAQVRDLATPIRIELVSIAGKPVTDATTIRYTGAPTQNVMLDLAAFVSARFRIIP